MSTERDSNPSYTSYTRISTHRALIIFCIIGNAVHPIIDLMVVSSQYKEIFINIKFCVMHFSASLYLHGQDYGGLN